MKKRIIRFLFLVVVVLATGGKSFAQTNYGETFKSHIYVGSNFALNLGQATSIDISPLAGYNFNRYFSAGIGATYIFTSIRFTPAYTLRSHYFGGRVFGRVLPLPDHLPGLFIHAEAESISNVQVVENPVTFELSEKRVFTPAYLVGLGYRQQAGENSYFTITLLYNLADDGTYGSTIYGNVILYRLGFIIGLY